jgi:predicted lipase
MIQQVTSSVFDGLIHKGFLEIYMDIRMSLLAGLLLLRKEEGYTSLYIGGHSLGGTCSQLLMADPLLDNSLPFIVTNKQVFLFGTPRVGNQIFCNSQQKQQIYRFQNQMDLVTQLPPNVSPNFIGDKNDVFLYNNNQTMNIDFYNQRSSYEENHSLKTYLYYFSEFFNL